MLTPTASDRSQSSSSPSSSESKNPLPPKNIGIEIARKGWPLLGVFGAMASTAWIPSSNPGLGFAILGFEVLLGIYGMIRLAS
jgi:hypothetical protein